LESNWIRDERRRAPTKCVRGREREAVDDCTGGRKLWFRKNVFVALGEKFADPQEEGPSIDVN